MSAETRLPQQDGGWFLTDGGIETCLIFQEGIALPEFAAFVLLESADGRESLRRYFRRYLELAANTPGAGFILESPTWRAGSAWGAKLGFDAAAMRHGLILRVVGDRLVFAPPLVIEAHEIEEVGQRLRRALDDVLGDLRREGVALGKED